MTDFKNAVRPVYEKLVQLRNDYPTDVEANPETAGDLATQIDDAEYNVLVAWAKATVDRNPNLLNDVESFHMIWYPALDTYFTELLAN